MSELSIKVTIGNRVYPLSVHMDEEEEVRKAATYLNKRIKDLESSFAVKDKQDLMAMLALELCLEKGHGKEELQMEELNEKIQAIIHQLDEATAAD